MQVRKADLGKPDLAARTVPLVLATDYPVQRSGYVEVLDIGRVDLSRGDLPEDDAQCMFALTLGEMFAIHADYFGHGDEELLAAFDAVARTSGAQRQAAMRHLGAVQAKRQEAT